MAQSYAILGDVAKDTNVIRGVSQIAPGGGVYYAAVAAKNIGSFSDVRAFTKCAPSDRPLFTEIEAAGVKVAYWPSKATTNCRNEYPSENPDDRRQQMASLAEPFTKEDLANMGNQQVLHVNALYYGMVPDALIPEIRKKCTFMIGDAQGFVRHIKKEDGTMFYRDWAAKKDVLKFFDLFKIDNKEAKILCGTEDLRVATKMLVDLGAKRVIATQSDRVILYDGRRYYEALFGKYPIDGRTGRGDTVTVSFVAISQTERNPQIALTRAAAITTSKMQYPGPYRGQQAKL